MIEADGGDFGTVRQIVIGFADVQRLLTRRVDGVPAFWNVEGVAVRAAWRPVKIVKVEGLRRPAAPRRS